MTNHLAYTPEEYRIMIKMSKFKYILVEGRDDVIAIKYLIEELYKGKYDDVQIDGAHQISFGSNIGNRQRVENIAESLKDKQYSKRFVGFVDREFREFSLDNYIEDLLSRHNIISRLIWARGHSMENYYFDFSILRRALRHHSATPYFDAALELFEQNLERIITLACALGLAGKDHHGMIQRIKSSIHWTVFDFDTSGLIVNSTLWSRILNNKTKKRNEDVISEDVISLEETFQRWLKKVIVADFNVVRWLCHGHIGITVIWNAYARCVLEVCQKAGCEDSQREVTHVLGANETVRCNGCASEWARLAFDKACEYPREVFSLLDGPNRVS